MTTPAITDRPVRRPHHLLETMGTVVTFDVRTAMGPEDLAAALAKASTWLRWVDATFSTYLPGSEISRLRRGELAPERCHPEVQAVLAACEALAGETEGFFDLRAAPDRSIDPSGYVKGWAAERASAILSAAGATDHAINAAGDVALAGWPAPGERWRIGIAHPQVPRALSAVVSTGPGAVATSGTAERGAHVFDPHTGAPARELASVTIVGPSLAKADAYATAALAMGLYAPVWLSAVAEDEGYESYVLDAGGHLWRSPGFAAYQAT